MTSRPLVVPTSSVVVVEVLREATTRKKKKKIKKERKNIQEIGVSFQGCVLVRARITSCEPLLTLSFCLFIRVFLFSFRVHDLLHKIEGGSLESLSCSLVTSIPLLLITPSWPFAGSCSRFDSIRFGLLRVCHRSPVERW